MSNDLKRIQSAIIAALSQHTAHNYRASTAVIKGIQEKVDALAEQAVSKLVAQLERLSVNEINAFTQGKYTTPRLKALKAEIDNWATMLDQIIKSEWDKSAIGLADHETSFMSKTMSQAFDSLPKVNVSAEAVLVAVKREPIVGQFVDDMLSSISKSQRDRIYATMRQGFQSGKTNSQVIRDIIGTQALNFKDGLTQLTKRDIERVVRTSRNHLSSVAYEDTYKQLGVKYVVRVATLEGRTCVACAGLDGKVYKREEPKPPATLHPNCRCQYAPSFDGELVGNRPFVRALKVRKRDGSYRFRGIDDMTKKQREDAGLKVGQVQAKTTYAKWFKNQDAAFQKQWLGKTRYELYKKGELSIDRFADPLGKQYTLEELRKRDAETFKAVFGD